jgi:hypothetical protein
VGLRQAEVAHLLGRVAGASADDLLAIFVEIDHIQALAGGEAEHFGHCLILPWQIALGVVVVIFEKRIERLVLGDRIL